MRITPRELTAVKECNLISLGLLIEQMDLLCCNLQQMNGMISIKGHCLEVEQMGSHWLVKDIYVTNPVLAAKEFERVLIPAFEQSVGKASLLLVWDQGEAIELVTIDNGNISRREPAILPALSREISCGACG